MNIFQTEPNTKEILFQQWDNGFLKNLKAELNNSGEIMSYPWNGIETLLGEKTSILLGYGSLLNPDSARRTIPTTPKGGHPPALCFGLRRLFNYRMGDHVLANYGSELPIKARAALNTSFTGDVYDAVNVRLIPFKKSDLKGLREREVGYNLVKVPYVKWPVTQKPTISHGWVLCAQKETTYNLVDDTLLPFPPYAEVCIKGANLQSEAFGDFFLNSAYLADGVSLLANIES